MIGRSLQGAASLLGLLAGAALLLMMLHIVADVTIRYVFNTPLNGTLEIVSGYYMVAVVFLPLALVERLNGHIVVELLTQHLTLRAQHILIALVCLASALYFGAFAWRSWDDALKKYAVGEQALGNIAVTVWPSRFFLPIGCGLIVLVLLHKAARLLMGDGSVLRRDIGIE